MGAENKKFSDSYLESQGVDAHGVKEDYGCHPLSHYDIYNGETVTIESKDRKTVIDTEMSKEKFFEVYGNNKEEWKYE